MPMSKHSKNATSKKAASKAKTPAKKTGRSALKTLSKNASRPSASHF